MITSDVNFLIKNLDSTKLLLSLPYEVMQAGYGVARTRSGRVICYTYDKNTKRILKFIE